jgi:hypothetical protein
MDFDQNVNQVSSSLTAMQLPGNTCVFFVRPASGMGILGI